MKSQSKHTQLWPLVSYVRKDWVKCGLGRCLRASSVLLVGKMRRLLSKNTNIQ